MFAEPSVGSGKSPLARRHHCLERAEPAIVVEAHILDDLLPDGEGAACSCRRRQNALKAFAGRERRGKQRMLFIDALAGKSATRSARWRIACSVKPVDLVALHGRLAETFDPDLARAIGADLDDSVVV